MHAYDAVMFVGLLITIVFALAIAIAYWTLIASRLAPCNCLILASFPGFALQAVLIPSLAASIAKSFDDLVFLVTLESLRYNWLPFLIFLAGSACTILGDSIAPTSRLKKIATLLVLIALAISYVITVSRFLKFDASYPSAL